MADYYSILMRAVRAPDAGDLQWRRDLYIRARQMLLSQLQAKRPPASNDTIGAELSALDAAIRRIEAELSQAESSQIVDDAQADDGRDFDESPVAPPRRPIAAPFRMTSVTWLVLAVVIAALGAGGYAFWPRTPKATPPSARTETPRASTDRPVANMTATAVQSGELPPGTDGGSTDADLPYYVRRQPTFYRTTNPVGSIIVDKQQHFLYFIEPNNVALRYGIGVGEQCLDLAGLRRVASKAEWPEWQPSPDLIKRKLAKPGALPGGPGNPLGAREFILDDNSSLIHGTNAPKTIGSTATFGCIRLVNDDMVDLYNRVAQGTRVIVQ